MNTPGNSAIAVAVRSQVTPSLRFRWDTVRNRSLRVFSSMKSFNINIRPAPCLLASALLCASPVVADEAAQTDTVSSVTSGPPVAVVPDLRDVENPLTVQKGDFVVVPIPMSSPTFGTGLIGAGAYFYPQSEQQKASQPASFTGAAGAYTNNDSWAVGIGQQNYWDANKWRFTGDRRLCGL